MTVGSLSQGRLNGGEPVLSGKGWGGAVKERQTWADLGWEAGCGKYVIGVCWESFFFFFSNVNIFARGTILTHLCFP